MKLKQQVTSLELSKKLKELGVEQKSLWYWFRHVAVPNREKPNDMDDKHWGSVDHYVERLNYHDSFGHLIGLCSAFTVAELGEMLPELMKTYSITEMGKKIWRCVDSKKYIQMNADTEANARAKMLIYLIENKLI